MSKPPVMLNDTIIHHGDACEWTGKKGTRYTQTKGLCDACDVKRGQLNVLLEGVPQSILGMTRSERERFYCHVSDVVRYAKCTKVTNPSCACGKLMINTTAP